MSRRGLLLISLAIAGCGARTGLAIDVPDAGLDAGLDAGRMRDAGRDAGVDARVCVPGEVALEASELHVVFVVDRSGSMEATFEGTSPGPGELSRWETLERAMADALDRFADPRISVGAKFFPSRSRREEPDSCAVYDRLDVELGPGHAAGIVAHFSMWNPAGGTPIGPAVSVALDALDARAGEDAAQFIVLATDGAPTCSDDAVPLALDVIGEAHEAHGVDVLVVGIASTEPEVALLDQMAVLGGRPLEGERRFYDARDPELLSTLLSEITRDIALCVFAVPVPPGPEDEVEVIVGGTVAPRDESRADGWDWTSERRSQLGLFGDACARAVDSGGAVRAIITCH